MRIALAQINATVGDFDGNAERIVAAARGADASLVVFPELAVCGYMPRDLLEETSFIDRAEATLRQLAGEAGLPPLVLGCPLRADGPGKPLLNAAVLIRGGEIETVAKRLLPTYDVFDEHRYFRAGTASRPFDVGGVRVGVTICEDMWTGEWGGGLYAEDPVADLVAAGADLVLNLSASPYERGKAAKRRAILESHVARHGVPMAFVNLVGGNDQLIFDGNSCALDGNGRLRAHAAAFAEEVCITDTDPGGEAEPPADDVKDALVLGIRDYWRKTGFQRAIVGMSGGVDSSLCACLGAEALGPGNVTGVGMPGPFSADYSLEDARDLAQRLGIRFLDFPIRDAFDLLNSSMHEALWPGTPFGLAEENLQARLRGTVLMSLANKEDSLILVPSNKSEFAMGYCTLYGDMVGALAPISDLYKSEVYQLARRYDMPARILTRPPSAELRPDQKDEDSLPPYDVLDAILRCHIEERLPPSEIEAKGYDPAVVKRVLRAVSVQEYKRQQAAPVLKVTPKAFGLGGRRFPIVERFLGGAE